MAASVLHFGMDECNRVLVLRGIGYSVDVCLNLEEFRSALEERGNTQAVLVTERTGKERNQIVTLTRSHSQAPLILFSSFSHEESHEENDGKFDLVIPPLLRPEEWLQKIAAVIEQSRALHAASQVIRDIAERSRRDSELLRQQSMLLRERTATERIRSEKLRDDLPQKPDPVE